MAVNGTSSVLIILILFFLGKNGNSQLIGEEKKYVFVEQAVLERIRPVVLSLTKDLEARIERLEEENRRISSDLTALKAAIPSPGKPTGCPSTGDCTIQGLQCPMFFMDPRTLHRTRYMSRDNLTVYNGGQFSTNNYVKGTNTDRNYEGAQGSRVITNTQVIYFETQIYYRIKHKLDATNVVFEVALATEDVINNRDHVSKEKGAWSVIAHKSNTRVVLFFKSNGGSERYRQTLSEITSGTEKYLTLGFFVNRVNGTIAVFDIIRNSKLYTFTGVDRDKDLWPVFSGHQAFKLDVHIRLNTEMNINSLPCLCCR